MSISMPVAPQQDLGRATARGGSVVASPARRSGEDLAGDQMRALVRRMRLTDAAVVQLLLSDPVIADRVGRHQVESAVTRMLAGERIGDTTTLSLLGARLAKLTGQPVAIEHVASRATRARRAGAQLFAAVLAPLCAYLVIGGLLDGQSTLMHGQPGIAALAAFTCVLCVLGLFEALHISVAQLKTSDLSGLIDRHPRAVALHREFRTDRGIKRFLAGRQLVVVVIVFFAAGLSSFPDMSVFPGTSLLIPGALRPFLNVGAPGALFVLWIGQLAPQFLATQRALRMMDLRLVGVAFRVAMALESIGFAKPGFWLSDWDQSHERIPSSPALRWSQSALELEGTGVLTMTRAWTVAAARSSLSACTSTGFFAVGRDAHFDGSITLPRSASAIAMTSELRPANDGDRAVIGSSFYEEQLVTGDRVLHKNAMPTVGAFAPGDILLTRIAADFDASVCRDAILVERPARALTWHVTFVERPDYLPPARVTEYRIGDGPADLTPVADPVVLAPRINAAGELVLEHTVEFPQAGTLFVFEWEASF